MEEAAKQFYNDDIDEQLLIHDVNFNDLFSNRIALLCGCDDYSKSDGLDNLRCAIKDIDLYESTLEELGFDVKTLRNENCTTGNITSELENIIERLGSKRVLAQFVFCMRARQTLRETWMGCAVGLVKEKVIVRATYGQVERFGRGS